MAGELQVFTGEQVDLIKRTICRDATNDELALFLNQCKRTGLDPFSRQIHAVKRGGKMTIQVGIDGLRLIATRTGELDGQDGPYWCGEDGVWKDVWLSKVRPSAAKVIVFRKGHTHGYTGVAHVLEYYQPTNKLWDTHTATMIAKVAESIALRKACPQELSGLYTDEEMHQADNRDHEPATPPVTQTPPPALPPAKPTGIPNKQFDTLIAMLSAVQTEDQLNAARAEIKRHWGKMTDLQRQHCGEVGEVAKQNIAWPTPTDPAPSDDADPDRDELFTRIEQARAVGVNVDTVMVRGATSIFGKPIREPVKLDTLTTDQLGELAGLCEEAAERLAMAG